MSKRESSIVVLDVLAKIENARKLSESLKNPILVIPFFELHEDVSAYLKAKEQELSPDTRHDLDLMDCYTVSFMSGQISDKLTGHQIVVDYDRRRFLFLPTKQGDAVAYYVYGQARIKAIDSLCLDPSLVLSKPLYS